jgi:tetratricopeptide (TPR) repeat protein
MEGGGLSLRGGTSMNRTRIAACAVAGALFAAPAASAQPAAGKPAADKPAAASPAPAAPANPAQPSPAELEQAKQHFAKGKELFDQKKLGEAVEEFKESYRLSKNPVLLYNIGFTLDQLGQRALALFYYQKFIAAVPADNPNIAPARERIEVLQKDIEDASLSGAPVGAAPAPGSTASTPAAEAARVVTKFEHVILESAPPGKPIDIGAFVPPGNFQVSLFFRAAGEPKFASVEMKARYNERVGRIPATRTRAPTVQYYIEARDEHGKLVERSGKSTSPNLIFIEKSAKPHYYADLGDDSAYHEDVDVDTSGYSGGGGQQESSGGGWFDTTTRRFTYLKWGATAGAVGFLALSTTFYLVARNAASNLEDEVSSSLGGDCPEGPPCNAFSGKQQDLEGKGERFELLANVSLAVGATAAVAAGALWYFDLRDRSARLNARSGGDEPGKVTAAPVLAPDFIGGAAAVRF